MKTAFSKLPAGAALHAIFILVLMFAFGGAGARSAASDDRDPLLIFAAASLAPVLEAATGYLEDRTGSDVRISYAASAVLARQIASGAPADVFISADLRWIDWLEEADDLGGTEPHAFARNRLVVAIGTGPISAGNDPAALLTLGETISTADPEIAPLGRYADEAIESYGLTETLEGRLLWAQNARSALALVETGAANVGLLYASDAAGSARIMRIVPIPENRHTPIVYVALLLAGERPAARALMHALLDDGMTRYLKENGLLPAGGS